MLRTNKGLSELEKAAVDTRVTLRLHQATALDLEFGLDTGKLVLTEQFTLRTIW
jgi:hypothetical protein